MDIDHLHEKCQGRDIVICGSAPSLNNYEPIDGAVHIALNKAFLCEKISFDLMISADYTAIYSVEKELRSRNKLIKLFGRVPGPDASIIPENFFAMENVIEFNVADSIDAHEFSGEFTQKANKKPVRYYQSVATIAMQIALYLNPNKIYLVGLDFSSEGHFSEEYSTEADKNMHRKWVSERWRLEEVRILWDAIARFAKKNYPEISIISINPVALKGVFLDIYRQQN